MTSEDEEKLRAVALSLLTKRPAGESSPPEIVVTYRKHADYEKFVRKIAELQEQLERERYTAARMSIYAEENFRLYDQLRQAYAELKKAGLDVSYITSVKPKKRLR